MWHVSEWQKCSDLCDVGFSFRDVKCVNITANSAVALHDNYCEEDKPKIIKKCSRRECSKWITSKWGKVQRN